jgi:hypothetical protein
LIQADTGLNHFQQTRQFALRPEERHGIDRLGAIFQPQRLLGLLDQTFDLLGDVVVSLTGLVRSKLQSRGPKAIVIAFNVAL